MRRITTTAFLGMLAITISGCPSDTQQSINPTTPSPSVVVQTPPPAKPPLVAINPSSATFLAPGLIQPTNANQRTKQVAKGNRDPFAALFLPVPVAPASAGNSPNAPSQAPQMATPTASNRTNRTQTSSRSVANRSSSPKSVTINSNKPRTAANQGISSNTGSTSIQNTPFPPNTTLPNNNLEPTLPPAPPETTLANGVMVMGVIQIGEQAQAIVQVPNEATSRYVQVGQRLSNGQVLVKRIELNAGAEPLVILEQYGVEVSKAVGEQSPSQGQPTTSPTAAVPYLPSRTNSTTTTELPAPPPNINSRLNNLLSTLSSNPPVAAK